MGEGIVVLETASVAMAVYNGEKYLSPQIDSILAQLSDDDELVISYDESQDGTWALASAYAEADSRVRIVRNDVPGVVGNFNNAIGACCKDSIFISDQDDVWKPGKRDALLDLLNATGADLAIHNVIHVVGSGAIISMPQFEEHGIGNGILRNFAMPRYSGCCMAFPASTKRLIMPMPSSVVNYDHWIGMVCEAYGTVIFDDRVFLEHRIHGGNVTTSRRSIRTIAAQRANLLIELIRRGRTLS